MRSFYPFVVVVAILVAGSSAAGFAQDASKQSASSSSAANASSPSSSSASRGATSAAPAGKPATDDSLVDENPVTIKSTSDSTGKKPVDTDPLFGVPPLPQGKTSLVGGLVTKMDGVHNRMTVKVFEGNKWTVAFDERTHFYLDGAETTFEKVKKGDRAYVDTMLDNHRIFARNVHIVTKNGPASAHGQVTAFNNGVITLHDDLSSKLVNFRVDRQTLVKRDASSASIGEIQPGSLITVQFSAEAGRGVAREVTILAAPGQSVTFDGIVRNLDLRNNQLAIENNTDNKTYEIAMEGDRIPSNVVVGAEVTVAAVFDGRGYKAHSIAVK